VLVERVQEPEDVVLGQEVRIKGTRMSGNVGGAKRTWVESSGLPGLKIQSWGTEDLWQIYCPKTWATSAISQFTTISIMRSVAD